MQERQLGFNCTFIHEFSAGLGPRSVVVAEDSPRVEGLSRRLPKFAQSRFVQTALLAGSAFLAACTSGGGRGEVSPAGAILTPTPEARPTVTPVAVGSRLADIFRNYPEGLVRAEKVAAGQASEEEIKKFNDDLTIRECQPGDLTPDTTEILKKVFYVKPGSKAPIKTHPGPKVAVLGEIEEGKRLVPKGCGVPIGDGKTDRLLETELGILTWLNPLDNPISENPPAVQQRTATATATRERLQFGNSNVFSGDVEGGGKVVFITLPNGEVISVFLKDEPRCSNRDYFIYNRKVTGKHNNLANFSLIGISLGGDLKVEAALMTSPIAVSGSISASGSTSKSPDGIPFTCEAGKFSFTAKLVGSGKDNFAQALADAFNQSPSVITGGRRLTPDQVLSRFNISIPN